MNLTQLQAMGAFVPQAIFKRDIPITYRPLKPAESWAEPDIPEHESEAVTATVTVHIRKRSSADFLEIVNAPDGDKPFVSLLRCVVNPDGTPVFTGVAEMTPMEQVKNLEGWFLWPLLAAVNEVNSYDAKKSTPRMSGGATSPSPSAAAALRSGRRLSRRKNEASG
jgi:hypothetical protein